MNHARKTTGWNGLQQEKPRNNLSELGAARDGQPVAKTDIR